MGKSPVVDALIALGVSAGVLVGATWFLGRLGEDVESPETGISAVACNVLHQFTDWTPSFPCWWLFVVVFVVIWGLVYGTARR